MLPFLALRSTGHDLRKVSDWGGCTEPPCRTASGVGETKDGERSTRWTGGAAAGRRKTVRCATGPLGRTTRLSELLGAKVRPLHLGMINRSMKPWSKVSVPAVPWKELSKKAQPQ